MAAVDDHKLWAKTSRDGWSWLVTLLAAAIILLVGVIALAEISPG